MNIVCKCNAGFEDKLTKRKTYRVVRKGENSYFVQTDAGTFGWYGAGKFEVVA